jgi:hypothetical protein
MRCIIPHRPCSTWISVREPRVETMNTSTTQSSLWCWSWLIVMKEGHPIKVPENINDLRKYFDRGLCFATNYGWTMKRVIFHTNFSVNIHILYIYCSCNRPTGLSITLLYVWSIVELAWERSSPFISSYIIVSRRQTSIYVMWPCYGSR